MPPAVAHLHTAPHFRQPWRERPPEMAAWPAKAAATDVVAHATLAGCHRLSRRLETAPVDGHTLMAFPRRVGTASGAPSHSGCQPQLETADAARGAATMSGGWRSSGTPSCQTKPMVDERVPAKAAVASLSTPTRGAATEDGGCRRRRPLSSESRTRVNHQSQASPHSQVL